MIRRWPPFGTCPDDFAYFLGLRAARAGFAAWPASKKPSFLATRPSVSTKSFGWFDFTLPAAYGAGNPITVNLLASRQPVAPNGAFLQVFGLQANGGAYTTAPVSVTGASSAPGVTFLNYCTLDGSGHIVSQPVTSTVASIYSFTIPGITESVWTGPSAPPRFTRGGLITVDGSLVPGGIAGEGFWRISGPPFNFYAEVYYWPPSVASSGGLTLGGAPVEQVLHHTNPLTPGATFSIGVYGMGSVVANSYVRIDQIEVVIDASHKSIVPLAQMRRGFSAGFLPVYSANSPVSHIAAPPTSFSGPPEFYLVVPP